MMPPVAEPSEANGFLLEHARLLLDSHRRLTGRHLVPAAVPPEQAARDLYFAPFVVLSHNAEADPLFTYANLTAQRLFCMPWAEIVGMPSRYSAEAMQREDRQRLLERVARSGFVDDYQGVRVDKTGRRFLVSNATVWNLTDRTGQPVGQAAAFSQWQPLNGREAPRCCDDGP